MSRKDPASFYFPKTEPQNFDQRMSKCRISNRCRSFVIRNSLFDLRYSPSPFLRLFAFFAAITAHSIYDDDFGDVRGHDSAERVNTLAAAGRHNLIMVSPI